MRFVLTLLVLASLSGEISAAAPSLPAQSSSASVGFVRNAPLPVWAQPLAQAPETKRTDALVVRLAETQAYIGKTHAYLINQVIQANDRSALGEIGHFRVEFIPAYQRLLLHKLAIVRAGKILDRTATANMRLLEQEASASQGVYGGAMTLNLLLDDVQLGDSLWITYTVEGSNPVFGNKWAEQYSVERGSPVELRLITFLQEAGRSFTWSHAGDFKLEKIEPVVDKAGTLKRTRFEWKGLNAVVGEPAIPLNYFPVQFLNLTEYKDWSEVARWASGLFPPAPASPQLDALVRQLAREPNDAARAAAALQWVQDEIRYFSVSIGENSHRPQRPDIVLKRRYGDCKDKTYLLVTLLRRLGIAADAALVNASGPRVPDKLLPSPASFDHAVVQLALDGKVYYVDPTRTGEKGAIPIRPAVLPGGAALVAAPGTSGLVTIPDTSPDIPSIDRREKLILADLTGPATLEVHTIYRQSAASNARRYFPSLSVNELEKEVLSGHEKQYTGLVLVAQPQLIDSDDGSTYGVRSRFTLNSPVIRKDDEPAVQFDTTILESTLQIPDKVVRQFPFALPYGRYRARYHMEIVWPELTRSHPYAPVATSVDTPFFRARDELSLRGRSMHYTLEYHIKQDEVAAASLPEMQSKVASLASYVNVTLHRKEGFTVLEEGRHMPMRELDLTRWAVLLQQLSKDKAVRKELGNATYCDLLTDTFAHGVPLGQKISRQRFVAEMATLRDLMDTPCGAIAAFKIGDYTDATRRFSIGPPLEDGHVFVPRQAWSSFHAGSPTDALRHMERYVRAHALKGTLNSADIADAIALYQRVGKKIPPFLLDQVPGDLAPWPRPVIAMQLGKLSPDQVIAQAEALTGDERDTALNDTWFHVAQFHFARGAHAAGVDALRWYPANGIVTTDRFAQAFGELWHVEQSDPELQAGLAAWNAGKGAEAVALLRRAATRKVPHAWMWLGSAYGSGLGVEKDFAEAKAWLEPRRKRACRVP